MKRFFWNSFVLSTILLSLVYVLSCFTPFISAAHWVIMGYLSLGFPLLLAALIITSIVWSFYSKKVFIVLLGILAIGSYHIVHLFGWRWNTKPFSLAKPSGTVRIMEWNVQDFGHKPVPYASPQAGRFDIMRYTRQQQPDIICIQDFANTIIQGNIPNLSLFTDSLWYPYYFYSNTYIEKNPWGTGSAGVIIFSKYPFKGVRRILYPGKKMPEAIIQADISINGVTRRIITTHLQSMYLKNQHPEDKFPWVPDEDSAINYSGSVVKKMNYYLPYHAVQAQVVRKVIDESPYPVIFSADMNEVPTSYCYRVIKGGLDDVFLKNGSGLGRTYYRLSPTLRIDYLFTSPGTEVVQFQKDTVELSDHYPQIMDVKW